jgi:hypothetical protein
VRWAVRVEPRSDSQCAGHMARRKVVFETWGGVGRGEGEGGRGEKGGVWKVGSEVWRRSRGDWSGVEFKKEC